MHKAKLTIGLLTIALISTNAFWVYKAIDVSITNAYHQASYDDCKKALHQALAIMPIVARPDSTQEQVIDAAQRAAGERDSAFYKDGFTWVGNLGLRFGKTGRLESISTIGHEGERHIAH